MDLSTQKSYVLHTYVFDPPANNVSFPEHSLLIIFLISSNSSLGLCKNLRWSLGTFQRWAQYSVERHNLQSSARTFFYIQSTPKDMLSKKHRLTDENLRVCKTETGANIARFQNWLCRHSLIGSYANMVTALKIGVPLSIEVLIFNRKSKFNLTETEQA